MNDKSTPAAALEQLRVCYGNKVALDDVTLTVPGGSVYALLGRNGAGKTSAFRCLLGQQRPACGRARLFGRDSWTERAEVMERVGVIPEEPDLPPAMTAQELGSFCRGLYRRWDGASVASRLLRFGVPERVPVGRLSKGQRAQVALSLALGAVPDLLLLDDPTLGLDAVARKDFFVELIDELAGRGTTVLLATHDLAGVEAIADRVGILRDGRLMVSEELEALKARYQPLSLTEIFIRLTDDATQQEGAVP